MKKLISLLAALAVVSACSFGALAAEATKTEATGDTTTKNTIAVDYDETTTATDGSMEVVEAATIQNYTWDTSDATTTYTYTVSDPSYQNTILAFDGTDTIKVGTIQYIDQGTADFTFALRNNASTAEKITVLMGGSGDPVIAGYIAKAQDATTQTFKISGTVDGVIGSDTPTVTVYKVIAENETTTETEVATEPVFNDKTFTLTLDVLSSENESYKVVVSKDTYLKYVKTGIVDDSSSISATISFGDFNASGSITMDDLSPLLAAFGSPDVNADRFNEDFDVNASGTITMDDISPALANFSKTDKTE